MTHTVKYLELLVEEFLHVLVFDQGMLDDLDSDLSLSTLPTRGWVFGVGWVVLALVNCAGNSRTQLHVQIDLHAPDFFHRGR